MGEAPGDEDVPEASPPPGAVGAEVEVPADCVADVAGAEAPVHAVTPSAARTAMAAVAAVRVVLELFISGDPMIVRCGQNQCRGPPRG